MNKFNLSDFSAAPAVSASANVYVGVPRFPVMFRADHNHSPYEISMYYDLGSSQWFLVHNEVRNKCRLRVQRATIIEGIQENGRPFLMITVPPKFITDSRITYDSLMSAYAAGKKQWVKISKHESGGYTHKPVRVDHEPDWGDVPIKDLILNAFADYMITMDHPLAQRNLKPEELPIEEEEGPFHAVPVAMEPEPVCEEALAEDGGVEAIEVASVATISKPTRPPLILRKEGKRWVNVS